MTTEDEMVGWHHQLSGHGFEQTLGDGEGEGSLACCSPWYCKELDVSTEQQYSWKHDDLVKTLYINKSWDLSQQVTCETQVLCARVRGPLTL